jgi:hypothetical protein
MVSDVSSLCLLQRDFLLLSCLPSWIYFWTVNKRHSHGLRSSSFLLSSPLCDFLKFKMKFITKYLYPGMAALGALLGAVGAMHPYYVSYLEAKHARKRLAPSNSSSKGGPGGTVPPTG